MRNPYFALACRGSTVKSAYIVVRDGGVWQIRDLPTQTNYMDVIATARSETAIVVGINTYPATNGGATISNGSLTTFYRSVDEGQTWAAAATFGRLGTTIDNEGVHVRSMRHSGTTFYALANYNFISPGGSPYYRKHGVILLTSTDNGITWTIYTDG